MVARGPCYGIPFNRDTLRDDRSRLAEHVHKIRDELATIRSNGFWKAVGVGALAVGGAYVMWKFFGSDDEDNE